MTKRLAACTGEYVNHQNEQKAEWTDIGALIVGKNGKEYMLLDPCVNLAGVLAKQNALAAKRGDPASTSVMVSVFEQQQGQQGQQAQQGGYNQQPQYQQQPQQQYQQAPQQGYNYRK